MNYRKTLIACYLGFVTPDDIANTVTALENRNLATIGLIAATSALARTESRGAHARSDFPDTDSVQACSRPFIRG